MVHLAFTSIHPLVGEIKKPNSKNNNKKETNQRVWKNKNEI